MTVAAVQPSRVGSGLSVTSSAAAIFTAIPTIHSLETLTVMLNRALDHPTVAEGLIGGESGVLASLELLVLSPTQLHTQLFTPGALLRTMRLNENIAEVRCLFLFVCGGFISKERAVDGARIFVTYCYFLHTIH